MKEIKKYKNAIKIKTMYIKTTDSNKKNNVSWPEDAEQGGTRPFWLRLNSICSFNCFYFYYIYICLTLATRSTDNYDNNKDTLCPSCSDDACRHGHEQDRTAAEDCTGQQSTQCSTDTAGHTEHGTGRQCTLCYTLLAFRFHFSLCASFTANCATNCFLVSLSENN